MGLKQTITAMACLLLLACGDGISVAPKDQSMFAEHFVSLFPAHDIAGIRKLMPPSNDPETALVQLKKMIDVYPTQKLLDVQVAYWTEFKSFVPTHPVNSTFQLLYHFNGSNDLLATVSLQGTSTGYLVTGANFKLLPVGLKKANEFHLQNGPWQDSTILILAIIAFLFSLYALVICIRTRGLKRKWLWIVFILFGVGKLIVNWTTGELAFSLLSFQLFSVSYTHSSDFDPRFVSVSLPLGAWVFLAHRKKLIEAMHEDIADQFGLPSQDER